MKNGKVGQILVVEDEIELKNILCEALSAHGYEVSGFGSGQEALAALNDQTFDILLTDLMMPEMDGISVMRAGLAMDPHLICIMMTGQGTIQTAVDAMKVGAFDYVLKPFRLQMMLPVLTRAMNSRHVRLENIQLREAVAIHELSQTIAFTLEPQTILSKLADAALLQSEADEVSVLLPVPDAEEFYVAAVRGERRERLLGERVPFGDSISSWVARAQEPLILNGEIDDERFIALWPRPEIWSSVSIPMLVAKKLIGVLNLNVVNRPRRFTLGQMKALTILASTAGAALESASLFAEVQQAEAKYRSIFENAVNGIFRATPDAVRFISVNPFMAKMFGYDSPDDMLNSVQDFTVQLGLDPALRDEGLTLLKSRGKLENFETIVRRKDGSEIWASSCVRAIFNADDELAYLDGIVQDITEEKSAEAERLRLAAEIESQRQRLDNIVANVPGVVWEVCGQPDSSTQRITFVSEHVETMLGYSVEECLATPNFWLQIVHPEDQERTAKAAAEAFAIRKTSNTLEFRWIKKDGTPIWVESTSTVIIDELGQPVRVRGVTIDISERKRAEAALRESEKRFRAMFEQANVGVAEIDSRTGQFLQINQRYCDIAGYSRDEMLAQTSIEITPSEDRPAELAKMKLLRAGKIREFTLEKRYRRKDGSLVWVTRTVSPLWPADGEPTTHISVVQDITERKRAESALRESEQRYRDMIENARDIIYSHDLKGHYTAMNGAGGEITGYTVEEALKLSTADTVAPEFLARATEMTRRKLAGENVTAYEMEIMARDGRRIPVEVNTWLMYENGAPVGVTGIARDITKRRESEAEMRFQSSLLEAQNEASIDGILVVSPEGEILSYNRKFLELWRLSEDQLADKSEPRALKSVMDQLVTPEEFLDRLQYLYDHPDESSEEEVQLKDSRVFDRHSAPVHSPGGEYYGRVWFFRDITDRKHAQAELSRLAAAVQQTADSIVITDPDGAIEYVNPAFEAVTGYSMKEIVGQNPRILKSNKNDLSVYRDLWDTITRGDVWEGQLVNRRKDGTLFTERATISAVRDAYGKIAHYVAVKKDMTHEIQLEDQLRQSQKMEAIGQLAGGVAHDFNNLLTAINGYSSLALQRVDDASSIKPYLEEVKKAGDRAANLTRQLLAFGRKQILQPLPVDLNNIVSDMNKMLRRLIGEDIVLTAGLAPDLKRIKADPGQIEQVLVNLVVNARDAMPTGGNLTIETANVQLDQEYAARHVGIRPGHYVMLAVSDTGIGMDEATRARIFEPFFTTKEKEKGTGLGLSTVYGIVQQSGGSIWVYSEPDQGTAFKVYLPELITEGTIGARDVTEDELVGGSETILLVEDEDVVRGLTTSILEGVGYKVFPARGGAEAAEMCADHNEEIDLLLTDVVMPQTSGKEVADRLTGMHPGLKVLFMSGYTDDAIVHHGVLDESVEFIQKPFTPTALSRKIRAVLDSNGSK